MAAFLMALSRRFAARGFSAHRFTLTMARTDIANYLRLAAETVSRVLRRFQTDGLIRVDRREVELTDTERLSALADRKSVVEGTSGSVRVDTGGCSLIKNKTIYT